METLDYNRLLLVSLWQYNHHGDEGLTHALFEETFGKIILPGSLSQSRYTTDKSHSGIDNDRQFSFMHSCHV